MSTDESRKTGETTEAEEGEGGVDVVGIRELGGQLVREVWIEWAKEQPKPKPSWLVEWADLSEPDREVDRRIAERLWDASPVHAALLDAATRAADDRAERIAQAIEAACVKSEMLTQEAMGVRSQHWRGPDYADGLDCGIETTTALVREAIARTTP